MTRQVLCLIYILIHIFSQDGEAQWKQIHELPKVTVYALIAQGNMLFAGGINGRVFYVSTDSGETWNSSSEGLLNDIIYTLVTKDGKLFMGTEKGIYQSTDNGKSWSLENASPTFTAYLAVNDNNLYAAADVNGVYYSTNNGTTWESLGLSRGAATTIVAKDTMLFVGSNYSFNSGGHRSYDFYFSVYDNHGWVTVRWPNNINALISKDGNLFVGSDGGIDCLSANGLWSQCNSDLTDLMVTSLVTSGKYLFAGTRRGNVFLSSNDGANWYAVSNGLPETPIYTLATNGDYIFAGTGNSNYYPSDSSGIWRRSISDITTIKSSTLPSFRDYSLEQNYPNPFNPSTKIRYQTTAKGFVSLKIYDVLGRQITTLVNQVIDVGYHEAVFRAFNLPSGIYYCQMQSIGFLQTKKMILLK